MLWCRAVASNAERVRRFYDRQAKSYGMERYPSWLRERLERDVRCVLELLEARAGHTVLDAGAGNGVLARRLSAAGAAVCAVDLSPAMVEAVRPHVAEAHQLDIQELDLGRRFDRVLCVGVLEFVADPPRCVAGLARHVAPGGRLVLLFPRPSPGAWLMRHWHRLGNDIRTHFCDAARLEEEARAEGLLARERRRLPHNLVLSFERPKA